MSSSRRSRSSQTAIFALAVGALIIGVSLILLYYGVNVLEEGQEFLTGLYPPIAVTSQGAEIRNLYTAIFLIAVAIFLVVEGLIIWTVIRYRRKPTDVALPPQTHGNNIAEFVWTIVPTIIVIFMFIVSWQTLNSVDVNSPNAQTKIRAVAGQFQWTFEYLDQTRQGRLHRVPAADREGRRDVRPGRADGPAPAVRQPQGRHPRLLRPAVPVQARRRAGSDDRLRLHGQRIRRGPDLPRPVRRAVRHAPQHDAVRRQGRDRRRVRHLAGRQGRRRPTRRPPPAPSGGPAGGPARPSRSRPRTSPTSRPTCRSRPAPRSASSSTTRTPASRTTSRSTRGRRPAPRSSRAPSSPAWRPRPTTSRRSTPAPTPSCVPFIRR